MGPASSCSSPASPPRTEINLVARPVRPCMPSSTPSPQAHRQSARPLFRSNLFRPPDAGRPSLAQGTFEAFVPGCRLASRDDARRALLGVPARVASPAGATSGSKGDAFAGTFERRPSRPPTAFSPSWARTLPSPHRAPTLPAIAGRQADLAAARGALTAARIGLSSRSLRLHDPHRHRPSSPRIVRAPSKRLNSRLDEAPLRSRVRNLHARASTTTLRPLLVSQIS